MSLTTQAKNAVIDAPVATAALSLPIWIEYVKEGAVVVTAVGGAVIVAIRIALAIREYRQKKTTED